MKRTVGWQGLKENLVTKLVRKTRGKAGMANNIGTVKNLPEYNRMKDSDRLFLQWTTCLPHPEGKVNMRAMMYANPELLGCMAMCTFLLMPPLHALHIHFPSV